MKDDVFQSGTERRVGGGQRKGSVDVKAVET